MEDAKIENNQWKPIVDVKAHMIFLSIWYNAYCKAKFA